MRFPALLLLVSATAFGKKPEPSYQDATLTNFRTVQAGQHCSTYADTSGSVNANTDSMGRTNGTIDTNTNANTRCIPVTHPYYVITMGEHVFTVTPKQPLSTRFVPATGVFYRESSLYGVLPGSLLKIRTEGTTFFVKSGKHESAYSLVSAQ